MDAKRQNKLLKLAIGRLQNELEEKDNKTGDELAIEDEFANKAKTFLTENSHQLPAEAHLHMKSMQENTTTTAPNSVFEPGLSKYTVRHATKSQTAGATG